MKNYITKEELRDVVSELTDNFMENERYDVTISLNHYSSRDDIAIQVMDRQNSYKVISSTSYYIIDEPCDALDVARRVKDGIIAYETAQAEIDREETLIELA